MYIEFTLYGTGENADELEKFIDSSGVGETTEIESVGDKDEFVVGAHIDFSGRGLELLRRIKDEFNVRT